MPANIYVSPRHFSSDNFHRFALRLRKRKALELCLSLWTSLLHEPTNQGDSRLPTLPLDQAVELLELQPGFLKIDVEGFEEEVLKGARRTITTHRPVLLLEFHKFSPAYAPCREGAEIWLSSLGYRSNVFFESELLVRGLFHPANT